MKTTTSNSDEHNEQAAFIEWCDWRKGGAPELAFMYANVNGAKLPYVKNAKGQRYSPEAMRLLAEGLKSGVPDLTLPVARGGYHGLYLETKWGKNKTSEAQEKWLAFLREQGYRAEVCYGSVELIAVTEAYLLL